MLRFHTSGESHGQALVAILQGLPAGLRLDFDYLNRELKRRQGGYGRGGRMKIESDTAQFLSGVRHGETIGSPITILIENRDWENWKEALAVDQFANGFAAVEDVPGAGEGGIGRRFLEHRQIAGIVLSVGKSKAASGSSG